VSDPASYRERVIRGVVAALRDDPVVTALGESGAAARGRADALSDLDLMIVAPLAAAAALFERVESALRGIAPISHLWTVEPSPFPGLSQRFYFLAGAPRHFAVDVAIASRAGLEPFLERERHGEAVVLFDREGVLRARTLDQGALAAQISARRRQLRGAVPVYDMLVAKELERGHALEALGFHQALLRALIELLGMHHRPERFDFGWRYIERELPPAAQALIARYAFVADPAALSAARPSLVTAILALLDELDAADPAAPAALSAAVPADPPSP
jgi:predicted nucleotidyltransferase